MILIFSSFKFDMMKIIFGLALLLRGSLACGSLGKFCYHFYIYYYHANTSPIIFPRDRGLILR